MSDSAKWADAARKILEEQHLQDEGVSALRRDPKELTFPKLQEPSFKHQHQPSNWSCVPTSFAMVMGQDVRQVMCVLGHDDERGFHVQELLRLAHNLGWAFVPHEFQPEVDEADCPSCEGTALVKQQSTVDGDYIEVECDDCNGTGRWHLEVSASYVKLLMQDFNGVLTGRIRGTSSYHAVAWCAKTRQCIDPKSLAYPLDAFDPDTFWLGARIGAR